MYAEIASGASFLNIIYDRTDSLGRFNCFAAGEWVARRLTKNQFREQGLFSITSFYYPFFFLFIYFHFIVRWKKINIHNKVTSIRQWCFMPVKDYNNIVVKALRYTYINACCWHIVITYGYYAVWLRKGGIHVPVWYADTLY